MYACESGDAKSVKLLLENGASLKCVVSGNLYYFFLILKTMIRNKLSIINWFALCQ